MQNPVEREILSSWSPPWSVSYYKIVALLPTSNEEIIRWVVVSCGEEKGPMNQSQSKNASSELFWICQLVSATNFNQPHSPSKQGTTLFSPPPDGFVSFGAIDHHHHHHHHHTRSNAPRYTELPCVRVGRPAIKTGYWLWGWGRFSACVFLVGRLDGNRSTEYTDCRTSRGWEVGLVEDVYNVYVSALSRTLLY